MSVTVTRLDEPGRRGPAPVLEVSRLNVEVNTSTGPVPIVTDLDLVVEAGASLGVVGESGSGKSMTALAITGLLPRDVDVTSGTIHVDGADMVNASAQTLRAVRGQRIGMVFQDPLAALNPAFTVGEQIAERLRYVQGARRKAAWARAVELLGEVGIPYPAKRARDYPHQFSGGMRQRIVIAAAIACDPVLLIADEPTTSLDVTIQAQILRLFERLRHELQCALVFISHDLAVVESICDDVLVMYAGQEVETGPSTSVLTAPRHPYTEALLASVPDPIEYQADLAVIPGNPPTPFQFPVGCRFAARCQYVDHERCHEPVALRQFPDRRVRCVRAEEDR